MLMFQLLKQIKEQIILEKEIAKSSKNEWDYKNIQMKKLMLLLG